MSGIFEHLAAFDDSERVAARQAVAVARKRVQTQFGPFLANAGAGDLAARAALIEDDINAVVASVVAEYGGDYDKIRKIVAELVVQPPLDGMPAPIRKTDPGLCPNCGGGVDGSNWSSTRPDEMRCTHCGEDLRGVDGNQHANPGTYARTADWVTTPRDTAGQWSSPEQLQGAEQSDIDKELADAPSAVGEDAGVGVLSALTPHCEIPCDKCGTVVPENESSCPNCGDDPDPKESRTAGHAADCECGFCKNKGKLPGSSDDEAEEEEEEEGSEKTAADKPSGPVGTLERQDITKNTHPDFSKERHAPKVPNTQMSGSPHPTEEQDITQKPKFDSEPDLRGPAATEEDLPSNSGDAGFDDGGESHGPNTDTWTTEENDPVTSEVGEGVLASVDPDKNPITEIMSSWEDDTPWDDDRQVQAAIWQYEQGES